MASSQPETPALQGIVVQGNLGPRRAWSKETVVQGTVIQGDFYPRKLLPVRKLLKLIFLDLLEIAALIYYRMKSKQTCEQ